MGGAWPAYSRAGSTVLPLPQPELLPPAQPLVPAPSVVPALSTQFDDLATLIVTGRLPTALAAAPALAPVQPAPVHTFRTSATFCSNADFLKQVQDLLDMIPHLLVATLKIIQFVDA